jgi:hypothetical protein
MQKMKGAVRLPEKLDKLPATAVDVRAGCDKKSEHLCDCAASLLSLAGLADCQAGD